LAKVEVQAGSFSLADLLGPDACQDLRQAAAQKNLGMTPLRGSVRVLDGKEMSALLQSLMGEDSKSDDSKSDNSKTSKPSNRVPERIVVRRASAPLGCPEIAAAVAAAVKRRLQRAGERDTRSEADKAVLKSLAADNLDCSAAANLPRTASLEVTNVSWDRALHGWEFSLRCRPAAECVPFMVRERAGEGRIDARSPAFGRRDPFSYGPLISEVRAISSKTSLVKVGQAAVLIWEDKGIRVTLPVICLQSGGKGEFVRARLKDSERIMRAEVVSIGTLRAAL
jgi:hypothetical protein